MVQLQVLNYLLDSKNPSLLIDGTLTEEFFCDYKKEFKYIKEHFTKYGNLPDKLTFLGEFKDFDSIVVNETPEYLVEELYRDRNKRVLVTAFNNMRDLLLSNKTDDAMQMFINSKDLAVKAKRITCTDILRDTSRYDRYIEKTNNFNDYFVKTGFNELDAIIGGWDRKEELATIVARTNMGKSWVLLKTAIAAAEQGLNVGLYSGEMSCDKVGYRMDTLISHIANSSISKGDRGVQNDYKKYLDDLPNKYKGTLKILTPDDIGELATVTDLRAFIERENLDMLCIDQHSLLEDEHKAKTPVEKASNISKDLKKLQVLTHIPIISACQQNRVKNDNGQADTTNIAQSDRIGQDSTVILFFEQKDDGNGGHIMTLHLVKSRDSSNGQKLNYHIDLNHGKFEFMKEDPTANNSGSNDGEGMREFTFETDEEKESDEF